MRVLKKYGAKRTAYLNDEGYTAVQCEIRKRMVRFHVEMPPQSDFARDKYGYLRTDNQMQAAWEQEERRRWRVLILKVKAKFEEIESEIADFDSVFLANIVLPNSQTVSQALIPKIVEAYDSGQMPSLEAMKIGTRSLLFGVHQVLIHPWFVAWAWKLLYGWPLDPRLWMAFIVHDWGYWGKADMDSTEGEYHPVLGARIMTFLFDRGPTKPFLGLRRSYLVSFDAHGRVLPAPQWWGVGTWGSLALFHSRFLAKKYGKPYSKFCVADKLAIALTPAWLYLPLARLSGEIDEYMALAKALMAAGEPKYASMRVTTNDQERWFADMQEYVRRWVEEHKDNREDTWTPMLRQAQVESANADS